jgi:hypothetical protein
MMNSRAVSAPYLSTSVCGSTPLFFDFDIVPRPPYSTGVSSLSETAPMRAPRHRIGLDLAGLRNCRRPSASVRK